MSNIKKIRVTFWNGEHVAEVYCPSCKKTNKHIIKSIKTRKEVQTISLDREEVICDSCGFVYKLYTPPN